MCMFVLLTSNCFRFQVRRLVRNGQLEIVLGGWVMPDEASTHYYSVIGTTNGGPSMADGEHAGQTSQQLVYRSLWALRHHAVSMETSRPGEHGDTEDPSGHQSILS